MLGNDRFGFENGNVIDPGDLPPGRPVRGDGDYHRNGLGPARDEDEDSEETDYQEARESARRLLNDIDDLDLTPIKKPPLSARLPFRDFPKNNTQRAAAAPYSPYSNSHDHLNGQQQQSYIHSMPSVEEARFHAQNLLKDDRNNITAETFARSLRAPYFSREKHAMRNTIIQKCSRYSGWILLIAAIFGISIGTGMAIIKRRENNHQNSAGETNANLHNQNTGKIYGNDQRFHDFVDYLAAQNISDAKALRQPGTPQYQAAEWIAKYDALQYDIPDLGNTNTNTYPKPFRIIQRYILTVLYYATNSKGWTHTAEFLTNVDECDWNNVITVPDYIVGEIAVGASCNQDLAVTSIFIPENQLVGSIPREIDHLTSLEMLGLQNNQLSGSIPDFIHANKLLYINLNNNELLSGSIPASLGDIPKLQVLGLGNNKLSGSVPANLGSLQLKTLAIHMNQLTGDLQWLRNMQSLKYLYVDHNNFIDTLDREFFTKLDDLIQLDMSHNQLAGVINLAELLANAGPEVIDLAHNKFQGSFPAEIELNGSLEYLNLRNNQFSGTIPETIDNLDILYHLDLQHNGFTGTIPNSIGHMVELTYLFLGYNKLTSSIVPPLNQLLQLHELSLAGLGLSGTIPFWMQYLNQLDMLDLSDNQFTGTFPEAIWKLSSLNFLIINDNQLKGPLPDSSSGGLKFLAIHNNGDLSNSNFENICKIEVVSHTCGSGCSKDCCGDCCKVGDTQCHSDDVNYFTDGLDYDADSFSFDPDILDEAHWITITGDAIEDNFNPIQPIDGDSSSGQQTNDTSNRNGNNDGNWRA
jgi:Leucine-rich repeat (LRR) protein